MSPANPVLFIAPSAVARGAVNTDVKSEMAFQPLELHTWNRLRKIVKSANSSNLSTNSISPTSGQGFGRLTAKHAKGKSEMLIVLDKIERIGNASNSRLRLLGTMLNWSVRTISVLSVCSLRPIHVKRVASLAPWQWITITRRVKSVVCYAFVAIRQSTCWTNLAQLGRNVHYST